MAFPSPQDAKGSSSNASAENFSGAICPDGSGGRVFSKPETLAEFKRISAMADAMPAIAPEDTMAYGKGGSIDWEDFHCFCVAGQMVQPTQRSSFCFIVNWTGPDEGVADMFQKFKENGRRLLRQVAA